MNDAVKTILRMTVVSLALGAWVAAASASHMPSQITFDENGNGTGSNGLPLYSSTGPDIGPGGMTKALYYLDGGHVIGDLLIEEPGGTTSDVVRFGPDGMIFFYSEVPEVGEAPDVADIGLPSANYPNPVVVAEQGSEGFNWADYMPLAGQPGFVENEPGLTYHIISDVPEPATMALLTLGGLALIRRRK